MAGYSASSALVAPAQEMAQVDSICLKIGNFQTPSKPSVTATQWGLAAPTQGWGVTFGHLRRPGSRPTHPQCAPPKSLRILLCAQKIDLNRSILANPSKCRALAPPPRPKPPNQGRGVTFMDVPSAPTKSGDGRLTRPKALGFYFALRILTRIDPNRAHRSN